MIAFTIGTIAGWIIWGFQEVNHSIETLNGKETPIDFSREDWREQGNENYKRWKQAFDYKYGDKDVH